MSFVLSVVRYIRPLLVEGLSRPPIRSADYYSIKEKGLESSPEYADYPKTEIVVAEVAAEYEVANRGTAVIRIDAPGTAPHDRI
jgi:hypothetical protein